MSVVGLGDLVLARPDVVFKWCLLGYPDSAVTFYSYVFNVLSTLSQYGNFSTSLGISIGSYYSFNGPRRRLLNGREEVIGVQI